MRNVCPPEGMFVYPQNFHAVEIFLVTFCPKLWDIHFSSISNKYSVLRGVSFLTKTLSPKCMSTSIYKCVLKCPPTSVWNQHTKMCLHLNTEWGHLKYLPWRHKFIIIRCRNLMFEAWTNFAASCISCPKHQTMKYFHLTNSYLTCINSN